MKNGNSQERAQRLVERLKWQCSAVSDCPNKQNKKKSQFGVQELATNGVRSRDDMNPGEVDGGERMHNLTSAALGDDAQNSICHLCDLEPVHQGGNDVEGMMITHGKRDVVSVLTPITFCCLMTAC